MNGRWIAASAAVAAAMLVLFLALWTFGATGNRDDFAARLDGAVHYSRRSVTTLIELSRPAGVLNAVLNLAHYCLSEEIAVPLREAGAERISVAPRPVEAALIGVL